MVGSRPELLVFDFDGVLTDNKVIVFDDGAEAVVCNRADGLGFEMLRHAGIRCVVLSKETNPVVARRCEKLRVDCVQCISDKRGALVELCGQSGIPLESVWYVGNDLNDLQVMRIVGRALCPCDAHPAVIAACHKVLPVAGGNGVARAIAESELQLQYCESPARFAIFVTVRTSSTRLPQKCLLDLQGEKVIEFLLRRLKRSKLADLIVVCTTTNPEDDVLEEIARKEDVACFRGSERDKLERWRGATERFGVEFFVTADGDDPFCETELIDLAFSQFRASGADFIDSDGLAVGAFTYGIKTSALQTVCRIKDTDDTEMMWVYFTHGQRFRTEKLQAVPEIYKRPEIRLTLDYPDDFRFFDTVVGHFRTQGSSQFTLRDVIEYLDRNPDVILINQHLQEQFLANQRAKTKLRLAANS
jgi:spore coat polysaccharide biosynthesis protein SpsF